MTRRISRLLLASMCASAAQATYTLLTDYNGANFFTGFDFFTAADPTNGAVTFVDEGHANATGLAGFIETSMGTTAIYMAADTTSAEGTGREAVRVSSNQTFQHGLFIVDILHIPTGCGTWPAFWMLGSGATWPNAGEIDIVEGVNVDNQNSMTLHTSPGFTNHATSGFSGDIVRTDCGAGGAALGCSVVDNSNITFGAGFNENLGGVYATEWTSNFIKIWFFPRSAIPADIQSGGNPDPTGWGTPASLFTSSSTSAIDAHFQDMQIIFDTTFCGDWAGQQDVWDNSTCGALAPTCVEYVMNTPSAFTEAYWAINSLQVFSDDGSPASTSNTTAPTRLRRRRRG